MSSLQNLRKKIKSVQSTAKLTQAMQMVAASKMNQAVAQTLASRNYSDLVESMIHYLSKSSEIHHPFLTERYQSNLELLVVVTSDRGLAGSFNSQVIKKAVADLTSQQRILTVGKKARQYFARFHGSILLADFPGPENNRQLQRAQEVFNFISNKFLDQQWEKVTFVYNKFQSVIKQLAVSEQIIPVRKIFHKDEDILVDPVIEPSVDALIDTLVPRAILARIYQIMLESTASEHSARMMAMKNATDNARDIIDDLRLTYQGMRQAKITREIIEVSSGAEALS